MEKISLFQKCLEHSISTDTRKIGKEDVFIALKGANFDGNQYCEQALNQGAAFCISDDPKQEKTGKVYTVTDTLKFLQELANYKRKQLDIPVIGITGSNGKTTNKELIHAVLSKKYKTSATKGNLNNHIGVPLTLLEINKDIEIAIVEMGANQPDDIIELAEIAEPTLGLITNVGAAHLEGFGSLEGVKQTKKQLFDFLSLSNESIVVYNGDDPIVTAIVPAVKKFEYGSNSPLKAKNVEAKPFLSFSYSYEDYTSPILNTHLIGDYNITNFLAAISFGILFEVPFELINEALKEYTPKNNRSQLTVTERNQLIVDCYNANPTSMKAAVENIAHIETDNKMCFLGDMLEMGKESPKEHQKIIALVSKHSIPTYFIGKEFKRELANAENCFENIEDLLNELQLEKVKDQLILLKGSRGIQLEKLIDYL